MTKLTPSDLRAEAEKLIRTGKMPSLNQVLDAIREVKGNPKHTPHAHSGRARSHRGEEAMSSNLTGSIE